MASKSMVKSNSSNEGQRKKIPRRLNYYTDLAADYSKLDLVSPKLASHFIEQSARFSSMKETTLPDISSGYSSKQIEAENKEWWPTHCEVLRQKRGDLLTGEYRNDLVYFCQDGPYYGIHEQAAREQHWWALITQPGVRMIWPIVMFYSEFVHFEWACMDLETFETTSKGTVCFVRRGHRGGVYFKSEQLTFYRDVFAPPHLLELITKG